MSPTESFEVPAEGLQLLSAVRGGSGPNGDGQLEISLTKVPTPTPGENEVTVRVEAAPINPSDLGLLTGPADVDRAVQSGSGADRVLTAPIEARFLPALSARMDEAMPVGNEGAGVVVAAGSSDAAQALLGKTIAFVGGASYSEYRTVPLGLTIPMQEGTTPRDAASSFVNPLTALGMIETMKREGHKALVHTAAASNLGQMLVKACAADGISLVNIVRRDEQAQILRDIGAVHVCNTSDDDFDAKLTDALEATGATLAFDATGGGKLAGKILACMERALSRGEEFSRYGSSTHKQAYIYGRLDMGETVLGSNLGMAWGVGGWLLTPFLASLGSDAGRLYARVAAEIKTTFKSEYTAEISLADVLDPKIAQSYQRKATGEKYLINPQK